MNEHANRVRSPAFWRRKADEARATAYERPEDRAAMENVAQMYEQMAERIAELASQSLLSD
jgi:hypothetical protein